MVSDHKAFAKEVDARAANLFKAAPDAMRAFRGLMESAGKDGALDSKTKELMALAVGIAVHCEGCINYHTREAIRKGASREEVAETAAVAIEMGGGPAAMRKSLILNKLRRFLRHAYCGLSSIFFTF